jgi:hypothetical protein
MSTLNSYFNTRKSRSIPQNEKTLNSTLTSKPFAIQAPQPIYESLPKNTKPKKKLTVFQQKLQQDAQRNSILYYLSPPKKVEQSVKVVEEEEEEDVHTLCKIRVNIPVSHVWNTILEEFDPTSQINQFEDLVYDDKCKEVLDTECDAKSLVVGTRRARNMLQEDDVTRVSNINLLSNRWILIYDDD